jgi:hypothetical protein
MGGGGGALYRETEGKRGEREAWPSLIAPTMTLVVRVDHCCCGQIGKETKML